MKALVYTGEHTLEFKDVARPVAPTGSSLVRIMASGIGSSDIHAYLGRDALRPPPITLGHEAAGVVVGGPEDGRRVTVNPFVTCDRCEDCTSGRTNLCVHRQILSMSPRDGAFAECVVVPDKNLVTVPDHVPFSHAALTEPLACGWHAVRLCHATLNQPLKGFCCIVIGGNAIGVGAALALAAIGADNITIIEPKKIRRARLTHIAGSSPRAPDDPLLPRRGTANIVIDTTGKASSRANACAFVRPGGVIANIGLSEPEGGFDIAKLTMQEIHFIGCNGYTKGDFQATAQAIFQGRLGPLNWIERRPLFEGAQAFKDILAGTVAAPKIILEP